MELEKVERTRRILEVRIQEEAAKSAEEMAKKADYKIQIWFKSDRSLTKPVAYTLSFWESGKRLHGGGDEMMYICRRHADAPKVTPFEVGHVAKKEIGEGGCSGLIPGGLLSPGGLVVCPHCNIRHMATQIGDSIELL